MKTNQIEPYLNTSLINYPDEEWRDVIGYDGIYSVSNYGRIKSEKRLDTKGRRVKERILKQTKCQAGSISVKFKYNRTEKRITVSELVGQAFLGNKKRNEVYCHLNKNHNDNTVANLIKTTRSKSLKLDFKLRLRN